MFVGAIAIEPPLAGTVECGEREYQPASVGLGVLGKRLSKRNVAHFRCTVECPSTVHTVFGVGIVEMGCEGVEDEGPTSRCRPLYGSNRAWLWGRHWI